MPGHQKERNVTDDAVTGAEATIREISTEHVWQWLTAGWRDMLKAPRLSLFYGVSLSLLSAVISALVIVSGAYFMLPLLLGGFLLFAPFLGIGPFSASRQLESGEAPGVKDAVQRFKANGSQILLMGIILLISLLGWIMVANLIVVFMYQGITPADWQGFVLMLIGSWEGIQLLVTLTYAGGIFALLVYAISAVSVPMLVDREVNVFAAIKTSWRAVVTNIAPMVLWAAVLVSIILSGFATLFLGLIVGYPLAAHASWHAYRGLVERQETG